MVTPPLASPDSLFSTKSLSSNDSVTTAASSSSASSSSASVPAAMSKANLASPPPPPSDAKQLPQRPSIKPISTPSPSPTSSASALAPLTAVATSTPPPQPQQPSHPQQPSATPPKPTSVSQPVLPTAAHVDAQAAAAAAKRRRAQTEAQPLNTAHLRSPFKPAHGAPTAGPIPGPSAGAITGNLASYGNAVTQLVPPRRVERRPSAAMHQNPLMEKEKDQAGAKGEADAITGRRRIQIGYITSETRRASTFKKRKAGLLKKAYELAELTGSHVLVVAVSELGKCYSFATPSLQPMVTHQEGQTLLKRCLANGQAGNDSTAFETGGHDGPSAFGVVHSMADDDDDEDDEDDSDGDDEVAPSSAAKKGGGAATRARSSTTQAAPTAGRPKAMTESPGSTTDRPLRAHAAKLTINPHLAAGFNLRTAGGPGSSLKPVFLSNNAAAAAAANGGGGGPMGWASGSGVPDRMVASGPPPMMDFMAAPNSAPAHIVAFDQAAAAAAAAVAHQHMIGVMTTGTAEAGILAEVAPPPPLMGAGLPMMASGPGSEGSLAGGPSGAGAGTRPRTGRQRAATMLNPIELHPMPSDPTPTAAAFMAERDMPSPVNALALNLGSAYIGAGSSGGGGPGHSIPMVMAKHNHHHGGGGGGVPPPPDMGTSIGLNTISPLFAHARTFESQAALGRPRSLTSFPSGQAFPSVGAGPEGLLSTPWPFEHAMAPSHMPRLERSESSGTLGKRKLGPDVGSGEGSSAAPALHRGNHNNTVDVVMQSAESDLPRKVARRDGAPSPGAASDSPAGLMMLDSTSSPFIPSSGPAAGAFDFPSARAAALAGRGRAFTVAHHPLGVGLADVAEGGDDECVSTQAAGTIPGLSMITTASGSMGQPAFGPAFLLQEQSSGFFHHHAGGCALMGPEPSSSSSLAGMLDPYSAAAVAATASGSASGNNALGLGASFASPAEISAAAAASSAPRAMMTPNFAAQQQRAGMFSGLMMSPSTSGMFSTLNFGAGIPTAGPPPPMGMGMDDPSHGANMMPPSGLSILGISTEPPSVSVSAATATAGIITSPPLMSTTQSSSSISSLSAAADQQQLQLAHFQQQQQQGGGPSGSSMFLQRLQQQYKDHHSVSMQQHQELQRQYAELAATSMSVSNSPAAAGSATAAQP
ncbi:hypothetical protein V8E36_004042 [Tilletia maclaganii]